MKFNITFENHPFKSMYKAVSEQEAVKYSTKKGFKCFQYRHTPIENGFGNETKIRMVTFENNSPKFTNFQ